MSVGTGLGETPLGANEAELSREHNREVRARRA